VIDRYIYIERERERKRGKRRGEKAERAKVENKTGTNLPLAKNSISSNPLI
jgi:hypothetical protein